MILLECILEDVPDRCDLRRGKSVKVRKDGRNEQGGEEGRWEMERGLSDESAGRKRIEG